DKLSAYTVVRERVAYDQVTHAIVGDALGYLRIPGFNAKTPGAVRDALRSLTDSHVSSLVVDLRANPGGAFDPAVDSADLLLPSGTGIVTLKRRGKAEERIAAKGAGMLLGVPVAVLVDGTTGSSAEFLTMALAEGRHARIVGTTTKGKWSV